MEIKIQATTEIDGQEYASSIVVNCETLTDKLIDMCFIGETGKPFRMLLKALLRTKYATPEQRQRGKAWADEIDAYPWGD